MHYLKTNTRPLLFGYFLAIQLLPFVAMGQKSPKQPVSAPSSAGKFLFSPKSYSQWFVVRAQGANHSYYLEKLEVSKASKQGSLHYELQRFMNLQGDIVEENLGIKTAQDAELSLDFFSYRRQDKQSERLYSGNFKNGKLTITTEIKLRTGGIPQKDKIELALPKPTILSSLVPYFIGSQAKNIPVGQSVQFFTLNEEGLENRFKPEEVRAKRLPNVTTPTGVCADFEVSIFGHLSRMCIESSGKIISLETPALGLEVIPTTESVAKSFFVLPSTPAKSTDTP